MFNHLHQIQSNQYENENYINHIFKHLCFLNSFVQSLFICSISFFLSLFKFTYSIYLLSFSSQSEIFSSIIILQFFFFLIQSFTFSSVYFFICLVIHIMNWEQFFLSSISILLHNLLSQSICMFCLHSLSIHLSHYTRSRS